MHAFTYVGLVYLWTDKAPLTPFTSRLRADSFHVPGLLSRTDAPEKIEHGRQATTRFRPPGPGPNVTADDVIAAAFAVAR
jgi:hypothetical protein